MRHSLGTLGTYLNSQAFKVNDSRQVAGVSYDNLFDGYEAVRWEADGSVTPLGTLGLNKTWATSINNAGQVVGASHVRINLPHAFVWTNGVMTDLGNLYDTSTAYSSAQDINNNGVVAGFSTDGVTQTHAVLWSNGGTIDLGATGNSRAEAINDLNQVVGTNGLFAHIWNGGPGGVSLGTLSG
ncbi:MAG: HAF repeat-containing protein, partial [Planctomycetes bacterium]|nr:HAF repeat-containing protein [Planctomycetota bacterium]